MFYIAAIAVERARERDGWGFSQSNARIATDGGQRSSDTRATCRNMSFGTCKQHGLNRNAGTDHLVGSGEARKGYGMEWLAIFLVWAAITAIWFPFLLRIWKADLGEITRGNALLIFALAVVTPYGAVWAILASLVPFMESANKKFGNAWSRFWNKPFM